jgi:protein-disulfide isomerase
MQKVFRYALHALMPMVLLLPLGAQEPGISKQQADEIINELRQIRQLLEKQAKPAPAAQEQPTEAKLKLQGGEMLGSKDAPLTMVEFTDYQCPFCQRFYLTTFPEIKKDYIDTGKLRFYSRDMPLDFHANAMRAAEAARCASDQKQFWALRDVMGKNPDKLDLASLVGYATELKMDVPTFRACVESGKYKNEVQSNVMEAMKLGATGTPSFIVGKSTPEGVDGELMIGAMPYGMFDEKLKSLSK